MTFSTEWQLHCDSLQEDQPPVECEGSANGAFSRADAISAARRQGWYVRGRVALCTHCRLPRFPPRKKSEDKK